MCKHTLRAATSSRGGGPGPCARAPRALHLRACTVMLAAAVAAVAAAPAGHTAAADARAASGTARAVHPSRWPALVPGLALDPRVERRVDRLLATLTWQEKVGQLIQADIGSVTPDDLRRYPLGSILAGGSSAPDGNVHSPASRWLALAEAYYRASVASASPLHPAIPILFGIDAVHGDGHIPGATIFPHNIGLGAAHDPLLLEQIGRATAEEVAVTGLDWTFAPTLAVARDPRWGRTYESYSEDPALVAAYARAVVSGLQGRAGTPQFMAPGHIIATAKHFLGDGGTFDGHDQGDNLSDERTLREVHGAGYRGAIAAGVLTVMASYSSWHGVKMHANHALLSDVLKGRWRFPGFIVSDWNAQAQVPGCTPFDCPQVLLAGVDMYMAADSWKALYGNLLQQVQSGRIPAQALDAAVRRILRVKILAGLLDEPDPMERPDAGQYWRLGSPAHRAIARRAVRESLVLLKNNGRLLPLAPRERVLVAGPGANAIGMQCGGWTIDWQGAGHPNADFPGGTSIFAGIQAAVSAAGGTAMLSPDGAFAERPDVAIVVFGERPYAEGVGDRSTLDFSAQDPVPLRLLRRLRAAGIPVVSVFLSGRPMWVNPELNASSAFIAAWLPGTEGEGIADALFRRPGGSIRTDFTGRLGFSWPATALPVTFTASGVEGALFPRGFGLSVHDRRDLPLLAEDPRAPAALIARDRRRALRGAP